MMLQCKFCSRPIAKLLDGCLNQIPKGATLVVRSGKPPRLRCSCGKSVVYIHGSEKRR